MNLDMGLTISIKTFYPFAVIFMYCEFGQRITSCFLDIDKALWQTDWYAFPIKVQKMIAMMLMGTQEPVGVSGFGGNLVYERDTFTNVI